MPPFISEENPQCGNRACFVSGSNSLPECEYVEFLITSYVEIYTANGMDYLNNTSCG